MRVIAVTDSGVRFTDDDGAKCRLTGPAAERIARGYSYFVYISTGLPKCGICGWPVFPSDSVDGYGAHVECVDQMRADMAEGAREARFGTDIDLPVPEPEDPFDEAEPESADPYADMTEETLEPA